MRQPGAVWTALRLGGAAVAVAFALGAVAPDAAWAQETTAPAAETAAPAPAPVAVAPAPAAPRPVAAAPAAAAPVAAPEEAVVTEAVAEEAAVIEAPTPTVDKADTAWMMVSTVLVLLMIIPGLALFYSGLVRTKNALSVLMQVSTVTVIGMIMWALVGYSLAFTTGPTPFLDQFFGGTARFFLIDHADGSDLADNMVATFSTGSGGAKHKRAASPPRP
ncbi:MAG: hypothetical protein WDM79_02710 [Terricaulis sp.]